MMASPIASSSRTLVSHALGQQMASQSRFASSRTFASSSRVHEAQSITLTFGQLRAVVEVPTLPAWLGRLWPAADRQMDQLPALAGVDGASLSASVEEDTPSSALEWDGLLHAVPKKKTSHSRKAMRSANKGLKDKVSFVHCSGCGQAKLAHHICATCYSFIARSEKKAAYEAKAKAAKEAEARAAAEAAEAAKAAEAAPAA